MTKKVNRRVDVSAAPVVDSVPEIPATKRARNCPIVYVAGPFRGARTAIVRANIRAANKCGRYVDGLGCQALIPHTMYGDWHGSIDEGHMIDVTKAWLQVCDAMLICVPQERAQKSAGTCGEIGECWRLSIPVFYVDETGISSELEEWLELGHEPREDRSFLRRAQWFLAGVSRMLAEKNRAYGNSAGEPLRVFSRAGREEAIRVRIDDKLSRVARGSVYGDEDTIKDLVGYFALLAAAREAP